MSDLSDTRQYLLAFKAGRAFRRGETIFVDPSPEKGAIILFQGDDDLMHFIWKSRTTNNVEEDLIMFHGDASFVEVPQSAGRVYVLKFQSSDQRHFFWMQDAAASQDEEFVRHLNRYLESPGYMPVWNMTSEGTGGQPSVASSLSSSSSSSNASGSRFSSTQPQATPEDMEQLRNILASLGESSGNTTAVPEFSLVDVLTPANIMPLFTSHPELVPTLFPHLPPDLPSSPSEETIHQVVSSPQFRNAVRNLDQALRTGLLGGLVRSLGLPEEAGTSVEAFLRAIQEQALRSGGESMDTD